MITNLVLAVIAVGLILLVFFLSRREDPDQLFQRRAEPLMMGVLIICGDCAGDGRLPTRTYLDRSGRCARCGGHSYLLASVVGAHRAEATAERLEEAWARTRHGRVIPFETRPTRKARSNKIAI
ncbi:MAG TPA: hypothetical protein VLG74_04935 [Blastocatellia bacterium]|nr:hypothetical protein [Blastocatellia bacterium]